MNPLASNPRFSPLLVCAALCLAGTVGCGSAVITPTEDAGLGAVDAPATDVPRASVDAPVVAVDRPTPFVDVPVVTVDAPTSTACGPANDGRDCDPVGMGCGSGGGPCVAATSCLCGADHRWRCTASPVGPSCDGGVITPVDGGPTPVCSLVGVYFASFDAMGIYLEFTADGRWRGSTERTSAPIVEGTYTLVGATLSLTGERSGGGASTCPETDVGRYVVTFSGACASLQLSLLSDDCAGRGDTLGRLGFTRQ